MHCISLDRAVVVSARSAATKRPAQSGLGHHGGTDERDCAPLPRPGHLRRRLERQRNLPHATPRHRGRGLRLCHPRRSETLSLLARAATLSPTASPSPTSTLAPARTPAPNRARRFDRQRGGGPTGQCGILSAGARSLANPNPSPNPNPGPNPNPNQVLEAGGPTQRSLGGASSGAGRWTVFDVPLGWLQVLSDPSP